MNSLIGQESIQRRRHYHQFLNIFWLGYVIYSIGYVVPAGANILHVPFQGAQLFAFLLMLPSAFALISFRFENRYLQIVFSLYMVWLLTVVYRGFTLNYDFLKFMFFDQWYGLLLYLTPLVVLFPRDLYSYKRLFEVITILSVLYIIFDILFFKALMSSNSEDILSSSLIEYPAKTLAIPALYLLFTFRYHSKTKLWLCLIAILLTTMFALIGARRGLLFMVLFSSGLVYLLYLTRTRQKFFLITTTFLFLGVFFFFTYNLFDNAGNGLLDFIVERGLEDTRSFVEDCFYSDMSSLDWVIGKGVNGEYFCPDIDLSSMSENYGYRSTMETDFYQIILKGGIISLFLYLLIAIPAIGKGLFFSNNIFSKAAATWILFSLISMYPATVNTFAMHNILVWVSIGICYSERIRSIPEEDMLRIFNSNGAADN